jgi:short-subunit dehydrogenase
MNGIALVTGASSGIGASFARRLAAAASGAERYPGLPPFDELWLVARRADRLEALAAELRRASGDAVLAVKAVPLDLAAPEALKRLAELVAAAGKPLRVFANNAGYGTYGPFAEVDLDRQLGQIDLNCRVLTEACGRLGPFLETGSLVVNTASLAGFAPLGNFAVYAASKAYALSFSVALAAEWESRGISVCALCPGSVESEFALVASEGIRKEVLHGYSADRTTAACLKAAVRGRRIAMPRLSWKLQRFASWLVGYTASARFAFHFMKRPHPGEDR